MMVMPTTFASGASRAKKGQPKNQVELIKIQKPIEIVMGNTGLTASTTRVVNGVKERRAAEPKKFERIFADAGYQGEKTALAVAKTGAWKLEIVKRSDLHRFVVQLRRHQHA